MKKSELTENKKSSKFQSIVQNDVFLTKIVGISF